MTRTEISQKATNYFSGRSTLDESLEGMTDVEMDCFKSFVNDELGIAITVYRIKQKRLKLSQNHENS